MATQPPPSTGIPSYGQPAPMSLPTPSYDDPPQTGNDPSYKPLPPGAQDPSYKPLPPSSQDQSYKPSKDPAYESTYRPLPSDQDVSIYKPPFQPGPDPSYPGDLAYHTLADPSGLSYAGPPPPQPQLPPYIPGPASGPGPLPLGNMNSTTGIPSYPPPPNTFQQQAPVVETMAGPAATTAMATATSALPISITTKGGGIKNNLSTTEFALREYMSMQRRRQSKGEAGIEERLRIQASTVLGDLQTLRQEVTDLIQDAESHRWRRFLIGGAIASFIPLVKKLFPRPEREPETANNTEYAFRKSKSLISRILDATRRPGIATVAFFVFAVLYVFQNEVSLRVGRTVSKRLKRLSAKVEGGIEEIGEEDLKLLRGWRWRVLIWSE